MRHTFSGRLLLLCAAAHDGAEARFPTHYERAVRADTRLPATVRAAVGQVRAACQPAALSASMGPHGCLTFTWCALYAHIAV